MLIDFKILPIIFFHYWFFDGSWCRRAGFFRLIIFADSFSRLSADAWCFFCFSPCCFLLIDSCCWCRWWWCCYYYFFFRLLLPISMPFFFGRCFFFRWLFSPITTFRRHFRHFLSSDDAAKDYFSLPLIISIFFFEGTLMSCIDCHFSIFADADWFSMIFFFRRRRDSFFDFHYFDGAASLIDFRLDASFRCFAVVFSFHYDEGVVVYDWCADFSIFAFLSAIHADTMPASITFFSVAHFLYWGVS